MALEGGTAEGEKLLRNLFNSAGASYPCRLSSHTYSIAAVSRLLGVPVPTLRTWERRYGAGAPARSSGGHRRYTRADVSRLRVFRDALSQGHRPREAAALFSRELRGQGADLVRHFVDRAVHFDAPGMRAALDAGEETLGLESAIADVALPAMRSVGQSWADASIDVAQEHLATKVVTTWLSWHDTLTTRGTRGPIVIACGPDEQHTLGSDAFALIAKTRGWDVHNLGALVPGPSLIVAVAQAKPRAVIVTAHLRINRRSTIAALRPVAQISETKLFYAGGAFASTSARKSVPGTYLGDSVIGGADALEAAA